MTQEEKYRAIKITAEWLELNLPNEADKRFWIEEFTPYLRPISSMTEEERKEYNNFMFHSERYADDYTADFDWLNAHHFDYRRLIDKGLALEAPENMYK